jgi:SAM-dependent methyltransferase
MKGLFAGQALVRLVRDYQDVKTILDVGSGAGHHADLLRREGKEVTTINLSPPADYVGDFLRFKREVGWDAIWASHVLEHQPNVGMFLKHAFNLLRDDGVFAVTVPPMKHAVVGGHLAMFNAGILVYNLIIAGFDCARARVSPLYPNVPGEWPYNISVIVRKKEAKLPQLDMDAGDIEKLAAFFPFPVHQDFNGRDVQNGWDDAELAVPTVPVLEEKVHAISG